MALERLQSVFNDIYQNEARSTDDMPSPSIDEIGDDHFYSSGFFDSINQILQPDGTYQPYGSIPIGAAAENSPMSKKLILSEAEPSTKYYSGHENQFGVRIRDVQGVYTAHQGMDPNFAERAISQFVSISQFDDEHDRHSEILSQPQVRFAHINGANVGRNNVLGTGKYVLEEVYDPTHGNVYADRNFFLRSNAGSRRNLDIKGYGDIFRSAGFGLGAFDNTDFGKLNEPYIIHNIPNPESGDETNRKSGYNRDTIPWRASLEDASKLAMFYTSPAGIAFMAKENVTNALIGDSEFLQIPPIPFASIMAPPIPVPMTGLLNFYQQDVQGLNLTGRKNGSARKPFKIGYSIKAATIPTFAFANNGDKTFGSKTLSSINLPEGNNPFTRQVFKGLKKLKDIGFLKLETAPQIPTIDKPTSFIGIGKKKPVDNISRTAVEDKEKDQEFKKGDFYVRIKDLRGISNVDNRFLYFRGYVTGINENINPSWNPIQYIGRSEDVYTYQKAERDLSFNLKVYPQNEAEFIAQYEKIDRLTSLAYPNYLDAEGMGFTRMQAPFTELYMGHIGTRAQGQFGFIKSLTYTIPEGGDWDAYTALPRMFDIAISYQILSKRPPGLRVQTKDPFKPLTAQEVMNLPNSSGGGNDTFPPGT